MEHRPDNLLSILAALCAVATTILNACARPETEVGEQIEAKTVALESAASLATDGEFFGPFWFASLQAYDALPWQRDSGTMAIDLRGPSHDLGTPAHLWSQYLDSDGTYADSQLWYLVQHGSYYKFQSEYALERILPFRCLDLVGPSAQNGTQVHLWDCYDTDSQLWKQVRHPSRSVLGYPVYRFINKFASERRGRDVCLDVSNWGTRNGAKIQIWECTSQNNKNQHWF